MKKAAVFFLFLMAFCQLDAREVAETVVIQPRRPRPCRCTTTVVEYCGICCMKEDGIRCCPGHPREVPLNHSYACSGYYPAEYSTEYYTVPDSFSDDPQEDAGIMEDRADVLETQGTKVAVQAVENLQEEMKNLLENTGIPEEIAKEAEVVSGSLTVIAQEKARLETPETGDPVCLGTGEYVTTVEEGFLPVGELDIFIRRYYRSQRTPLAGLFGTQWRSNLEDRILRGFNPLAEELVALQTRATNEAELAAYRWELLREQTVETLDKMIDELTQNLSLCGEALDSFQRERAEAAHEKFKTFFDGLIITFEKTSRELEEVLNSLVLDRQRLEDDLFPGAVDLLNHILQQEWKEDLLRYQNQYELSLANQALNGSKASGELSPSWGNGTVTLIDEQGRPLLFTIDAEPQFESLPFLDGTTIPNHYSLGSNLTGPSGLGFTLSLTSSGQYVRRYTDGSVKTYGIRGRPLRWEDRNGRGINYIYQEGGGVLQRLTTDDGRTILLNSDDGLIEEIQFPQGRYRSYQYEASRLVSVTDGRGDCVRYEYMENLLTRVIKPDNSFRQYHYKQDEGTGKMVVWEGVDEEGGRELFSYDFENAQGTYVGVEGEETHQFDEQLRVIKITYADGSWEEWEYEDGGRPGWYRDRRGEIYSYQYDHQGNTTGISKNGVTLEERVFSAKGFLQEERSYSQGETAALEYVRDQAGRIVKRLLYNFSGSGSRGEQKYFYHKGSKKGLVSIFQDAEGHQVFYDYDDRGFLISRSETLSSFFSGGKEESRQRREEYIKTDDDKIEERKLYDEETVVLHHRYLWDPEDRLLGIYDLINHRYLDQRVYNSRGDMIENRDQRGALWKVRYDRCHRPLEIYNPLGELLTLTYDNQGRLKERRLFSQQGEIFESWRFAYDRVGRRIREEEQLSGITREYGYYPGGDVARESRYLREAPQDAVVREYYYNLAYPGPAIPGAGKTVKIVDQGGWTIWEIRAVDSDRLICRISPEGRVTRWDYNGFGYISGKSGLGDTFRFRFDREGRIIERFQGGVTTRQILDGRGRICLIRNQDGEELERRGYGVRDELVYRRNPLGGEESFRYDSLGRIVQRTGCDGTEEYWSYPSGERVDYTDQAGYTWGFKADSMGRQIAMVDPQGNETRQGYDPRGRLVLVVDPAGGTIRFRYDPNGRLLETEDPLKMTTSCRYDPVGRPVVFTDQTGVRFLWDYTYVARSEKNLLITSSLVDGRLISREYTDGDGLLVRKETPSGAAYQWEYDETGRAAAEISWEGIRKEYHYQNERLSEASDFEGRVRRFQYDLSGRLTGEDVDEGDPYRYRYDLMGNLLEASRPEENLRFTYDSSGRMVSQENRGETIQYQYSPRGQISRMTWSSGETASFRYNPQGRTAEISDYSGARILFNYDVCGRITQEVFPNGLSRDFSYDPAGRLQQEILRRGGGLSSEILSGTCFGYDPRGLLVSEVFLNGGFNAYRYDSSGRLVQAVYPDTMERRTLAFQVHAGFGQEPSQGASLGNGRQPYPLSSSEEAWLTSLREEMERLFTLFPQRGITVLKKNQSLWSETFLFDGDGNRIQKKDGLGIIEYRYEGEDPHALTHAGSKHYEYDRNGNLTDVVISGENDIFRYDSRGLMVEYERRRNDESTLVTYQYDGLGRRSGAVRTLRTDTGMGSGSLENWTYQGSSFLPLQRDVEIGAPGEPFKPRQSGSAARLRTLGTGDVSREEKSVQTYLYRDQKLVFLQYQGREPSLPISWSSPLKHSVQYGISQSRYLLTDIRGSLIASFDDDGNPENTRTYSAYGTFLRATDDYVPLGFNNKPFDHVSGLYGYGFRDYHPGLGLFFTRDPVKDGLNWYGYCYHDPVNFTDPLGLDDVYAVYNDSQHSMEVTYVNTTDYGDAPLVAVMRMTATNNVRNEIDPNNVRLLPDVMTSPENQGEAPRHYYPRKFPQGVHNLSAEITAEGMHDAMGKYNINTDATQLVPTYKDPEGKISDHDQLDGGYRIHAGEERVEATTLGCIRMTEQSLQRIWSLVHRAESSGGNAIVSVGCNN